MALLERLERYIAGERASERARIVCFEFEKWRRAAYL